MKKIKLLIFALALIVLCLSFTVVSYASEADTLTVSEDFNTVALDGVKYIRVSNERDNVSFKGADYIDIAVEFSAGIVDTVEYANVYSGEKFINLCVCFYSGAGLDLYYVREDTLAEYHAVDSLTAPDYLVHCYGQNLSVTRAKLSGKSYTLTSIDYVQCASFLVDNYYDNFCSKYSGEIIFTSEGCYYLDYIENGVNFEDFEPLDYETLVVHKIEDNEIIDLLRGRSIVKDDMTFIYFTIVLMGVLFGVIPLVVGIICAVKLKGAKSPYNVLAIIAIVISVALIVLLVTMAVMALPFL